MATLQDGYLQVASVAAAGTPEEFWDIPGSYHTWGCGFSFADGHEEMHTWQTPILKIPVRYPYRYPSNTPLLAGVNNKDWLWFTQRSGCPIPAASP